MGYLFDIYDQFRMMNVMQALLDATKDGRQGVVTERLNTTIYGEN
nr:MAG: hypothetical protein J07AB56_05580 [Candidatus Nanosalinarum sp. J07AB56]